MTNKTNVQNPGGWLGILLQLRDVNRGWRQIMLIVLPFAGILFEIIIVSIGLSWHFLMNGGFWPAFPEISKIVSWMVIILPPTLLAFTGVYLLFKTAYTLVFELHKVNQEAEQKVKERIRHRFWGLNAPFTFSNIMIINSTTIDSKSDWSSWLGGPTSLIINDGFAVYLERGNKFSRVVGAGFPIPFLRARETIKAIVDLRPQLKEAFINAWSNDGIKVALKIRMEIQINPNVAQDSQNGKLLYPFNTEAVRKAVEFTAVRSRDGKLEEVNWCDGAVGNLTGRLSHHISSHHFDELFMRNDGQGQILSHEVINSLLDSANKYLVEIAGVKVLSIQITEISIPAEIRQQRLNVWGAKKDSVVARIQGEAQAYRIRTNEEARARAQRDLIVAIAKSLGKVDSSHFPDEPLLMSLSGILDQGLRDPLVQTYMARGTLDALQRLKELL